MKRPFITGVMGLALAGCAHSRSDVAQDSSGKNRPHPVALQPVPSIYETINRGTGNAAMSQTALNDPNNPKWSGRAADPAAQGSSAGKPAPGRSPGEMPQLAAAGPPVASQPPALAASPDPITPAGNEPVVAGAPSAEAPDQVSGRFTPVGPSASAPTDAVAAGTAAASTIPAMPGTAVNPFAAGAPPTAGTAMAPGSGPVATGAGAPAMAGSNVPTNSIPYTLDRPGGPMPDSLLERPGPRNLGGPSGPSGPADMADIPAVPPGAGPASPPGAGPSMKGLEPVGEPPAMAATHAPIDAAVSPSAGAPATATKPRPAGDPLLGPNPNLMPELPPLPADVAPGAGPAASKPAAASKSPAPVPAQAPAPSPAAGAGDLPPIEPASLPTAAGPPADVPAVVPELGGPSADNRPTGAFSLDDLPPLAPVRSLTPASEGIIRTAQATASAPIPVRRATARRDGQIVRASYKKPGDEPTAAAIPVSYRHASMIAAKVGNQTITIHDLLTLVNERCKSRQIPYNRLPHEQKEVICRGMMTELINESLLIEEAKRTIKDAKMYGHFQSEAERFWHDDQLPKLEIEFAAENESQLRDKLKEHGRSLETIGRTTRRSWMAEAFLHAKMKDKLKVELPELLKYYNQHIHDREFDRPAQITWREIVVETSPQTNREQARHKIEAIHESLRRGADFAATARSQSDGPSQSRNQGGLMQTSPGSYGVSSVNEALGSLPIGQVSEILEGPSSFHIVQVDARRVAGPAAFDEMQDQIRNLIAKKRFETERKRFIQKLRDETVITTFLDDGPPPMRQVRR